MHDEATRNMSVEELSEYVRSDLQERYGLVEVSQSPFLSTLLNKYLIDFLVLHVFERLLKGQYIF